MAQTQVRRIQINVDTSGARGIKEIAEGFKNVNRSIAQTNGILGGFQSSINRMKGLFTGMVASFGIKQFVDMADAWQKAGDRLRIVEGSAEKASVRLEQLTKVANENKMSIKDTSDLFVRYSQSLDKTGEHGDAVLEFTNLLQKSFRIAGATTAEASSAAVQLSQAFSSATLQGGELRSVLEANVVVGKMLNKVFPEANGNLIRYAEKIGGLPTDKVIRAMADSSGELNRQTGYLSTTVGESLTVAYNKLTESIGKASKEFGVTKGMVTIIDSLSSNIDKLAIALGGSVLAWGAYTIAVNAAAWSTKAFLAVVGSPIVGALVAAGTAVATFLLSTAGIAVTIIAATTALVSWIALSDDFRGTLKELGSALLDTFRTEDYKTKMRQQAELSKEGTQLAINWKNATRELTMEMHPLQQGFMDTTIAMRDGTYMADKNKVIMYALADAQRKATSGTFDFKKALATLNIAFLEGTKTRAQYNKELKSLQIQDLTEDMRKGAITKDQFDEKMRLIEFGKPKKSLQEFREEVEKLNRQFNSGGMSMQDYAVELNKLELGKIQRELTTGQSNKIDEMNKKRELALNELNQAYVNGSRNMYQYTVSMREMGLKTTKEDFERLAISADEYHRQVVALSEEMKPGSALYVGAADYAKSVGNLNQNIATGITQTFGRLENAMVEFTQTGKFVFRDFAKQVIEDINRIIIRAMIIRPLAEGILSGIGGGNTNTYSGDENAANFVGPVKPKALGAAYNSRGVEFFNQGGIVSKPTMFKYGSGKTGVAGESGPEAIIPLKRGANGELGVQAGASPGTVVNVYNNAKDTEVEAKEITDANGTKRIEIMIKNTVMEGMARGDFDKQFRTFYGLNRR